MARFLDAAGVDRFADVLYWPRQLVSSCPRQANGDDCGAFTLMAAQQLAFGSSLPRAWQQGAVDAFRAHVADNIVHGKGELKRMAVSLPVDVPNRKRAPADADAGADAGKSWFFCFHHSPCYLFLTRSTAPPSPHRSPTTPQPQHIDSDTRCTSGARAGARQGAR